MGTFREGRWPRLLRVLVLGLAALMVLVLLGATGFAIALRRPGVQQSVLDGISERVEADYGFSVAADGFDLGLLEGWFEIRNLKLSKGPAEPFVRIERVRARFAPTSLLRDRIRLKLLEFEGAEVHLDAPLPAFPEAEPDAPALESLPFTIERIRFSDGEIRASAPDGAREFLENWRIADLGVEASFDGRRLAVDELTSEARIGRGADPPIELRLEAAATVALSGEADIQSFRVAGEGLVLDASMRVGRVWDETSGNFHVEADPGTWLRGVSTGPITLEGRADLAVWSGSAHLEGRGQPGTLLGDLVSADVAALLELASTDLSLELDLNLEKGAGGTRDIVGSLSAVALRGRDAVAEVAARPRLSLGAESTSESRLDVETELRLLPGEAGVRTVSAQISATEGSWGEAWRIGRGEIKVEQPSIGRLLAVASELWPKLLEPASVRALPDLGALRADGDFAGSLDDPRGAVRAEIRPPSRGRIRLTAEGSPLSGDWSASGTGSGLEIGQFTDGASGRFGFSGTVTDPLGSAEGKFDLAAQGVATESGEVLSSLDLVLSGDRTSVSWKADGELAKGGTLAGRGTVQPGLPLRRASGDLIWQTDDQRLPRVDGSFALAGGVLTADLTAPVRSEATAEAKIVMPLGALEALPELGDFSALPIEKTTGPVVVSWRVSEGDWREFLPANWIGGRLGRLEGGSTGRLSLDLACPSCSTGSAKLRGLGIELDGRQAEAGGDLTLEFVDGRARIEPWSIAGEGLQLELEGEVGLSTGWRLGDPGDRMVSSSTAKLLAEVDSSWLEAFPIEVASPGTIRLQGEVTGPFDELVGLARLETHGLQFAPGSYPSMVLGQAAADVALAGGMVEWKNARLTVNEVELRGEGRVRAASPLEEAEGTLRAVSGLPVVSELVLPFELTHGLLEVQDGRVATTGGDGSLQFELPLDGRQGATARARWNLPANDWAPLLAQFQGGEDPEVVMMASQGTLSMPLDRPATAKAQIQLSSGRLVVRGRETLIDPSVELLVEDGQLRVEPFHLRTASESFLFEGRADLKESWSFADAPTDLIRGFDLLGKGDIDAGLLNPFLSGGRAEGSLNLALEIEGTPVEFGGRVVVEGPQASILYRSPYLARIERPSLDVSIKDGRLDLDRGSFLLNEGALQVGGLLFEKGRSDLEVRLADAVFRLDYGLLATLGADLNYRLDDDGRSTVSGTVDVERGALTRSVQLDLDLLSQLLTPIDLTTTEDDPLDLIGLDLEVRTREGVRVKNNLGDLLVRWEPLKVTGTLTRPILEGRLEVDPGGLLYAYGQTVRLDRAAIEYPGEEGLEPRLDVEATTSLEDPTIGQLAGDDPFRSVKEQEETAGPMRDEITQDLARYYGEQFAGRVGESVGVKLSLRPLLIFGEADPGARLTVSRDLSANFALAASLDLRNAEARTYLLEAHEMRTLPRLVAQVFTDDASDYGGALLQRQSFGGSRRAVDGDLPRISKVVADPPKRTSRRGIKRALGLEKGDLFDPRQRFVAEVELVDYLMRRGYPDARVSVRVTPEERRERRVRLEVEIESGPFVAFDFQGEEIAKPLRAVIRSLYRADFFELESIEEMRIETVRALRSRGFLEPRVEILVEEQETGVPAGDRRVLVKTDGGIKISPDPPIFLGLPAEDVGALGAFFASAVQRVELAVGMESADRRLLAALEGLGYPDARIVSRYQTLEDRVLTVEIDPGPRLRIASVVIEGVGTTTLEVRDGELRALLEVAEGDPLRRTRLSRSAIAIEREFGARGYLDARVRTILEAAKTEDLQAMRVRFVVEPGPPSRLAEVEFQGLRSTQEPYARRVAGLETGELLARDDLSRARTALWRTGLFSGVGAETVETGPGLERVVFDVEERDRYRLTYGVRWDSEDGIGAVLDATDDNFLGRGWTLGLRALASNDEDSLRGLTRLPRAFGGSGSLELFAAVRQLTEISTFVIFGEVEVPVEVLEGTLQYSHPVTQHTTLRIYGRYTDTTRELPFFALRVKNPQLGLQYLYDRRSPEPLTERGILASVDLSGSEDFLGGDLRYARMFSQLSLFRPAGRLFGSRLSWAQAYRVGLAEAFDQELTKDVLFFAGGEYSVRGYGTESLGELERFASGVEPVGGSALLVVNQELRWRLFGDYTMVLFADAGNVWQDVNDLGSNLFTSAGLGVRAVTPVGLLRLDIAHALDRRLGVDPEFKIYFGLGTTF